MMPAELPIDVASKASCSVIVPCRNERETVVDAVRRIPDMGRGTEILFVVGGDTDGTTATVQAAIEAHPERNVRLIAQQSAGKGGAVREGFAAATGEVLMILDGDLTVAPEALPEFYEALVSGRAGLVIGCRLVYPMAPRAMRFLNRLINRFFAWAMARLAGQRIRDALCGTKALWATDYARARRVCQELGLEDPFGDFDLILGCAVLGKKIVEVPVRYGSRVYGQPQIRRFYHGWKLFKWCGRAWCKRAFAGS